MNYTVIYDGKVFHTKWFEPENNWVPGMIVIDRAASKYTTDGVLWVEIPEDHL